MKYFIIGDEDSVLGFGMVGVDGRVAATGRIPAIGLALSLLVFRRWER